MDSQLPKVGLGVFVIKNIRVAGVTNDIFRVEDKHYVTIWCFSEWSSGEPIIMEPDKFLDLGWKDFNTLPENLFLPWSELLKSDFIKLIKNKVES